MSLRNFRALADAEVNGASAFNSFRKYPTQATTAGVWFDLSLSPGNPNPQYYASSPMVGKGMAQSTDGGILHGGNVAPRTKYLRELMLMQNAAATALPARFMLLDYLYYYPFVDMGTTDVQPLDSTAAVPRLPARGAQILPVVVAGQTGGGTFKVYYTSQDGTTGRVTPNVRVNTQNLVGTIASTQQAGNGAAGPFMPLQGADTGVRAIESVQFNTEDVGLITFVLVVPIADVTLLGIDAPVEVDFARDWSKAPEIADDAYLNFIVCPQGTLATHRLFGTIKTIWS